MEKTQDNYESNVTNDDNDAREEDIVEDTDSDTKDIINTENENYAETERRFIGIEATLERILGEIASIREAQGILVENGAVVTETEEFVNLLDDDAFVPPAELDLLI